MKKTSLILGLVLWLVFPGIIFSAQTLDRGAVVFTFDDEEKSVYTKMLPIMAKYNLAATLFIITDWVGASDRMTYNQLRDLYWKGWEIGNHTANHASLPILTDAQIREVIQAAQDDLLQQGIDLPISFAPPFGDPYDDAYPGLQERMINILQSMGFVSSRRAWTEDNALNDPITFDQWGINVVQLKKATTYANVKSQIDKAMSQKKILVLAGHGASATPANDYEVNTSVLSSIATYINTQRAAGKLDVLTLDMAVEKLLYYKNLP